ncbi:tRNA (guanine-N(7)-)-methyltransferase subunit TRM82 [Geosmithia morbida]|uniref:tRNA (Guanine-N(7)-)-methyltransferase subunit TRM82 n=1 Tax=Geosmithia morbida TaxID=1094350 RepID=A0A9P4YXE3_9HYPO|nr:tRNA (guanine-N(7)-)-methyltransferase subunit TRM82 [Geosmithia morbida]KAF4123562.1 tRNA (guanine-N(7)-)-methyltransferase subunit TRM82 [Geosmithia morbida]
MKIPYSQVHVNSDIIFAGRSGQIQTFNLKDGSLIFTWKHPDVGKVAEAVSKNAQAAEKEEKPDAVAAAAAADIAPKEQEQEQGQEQEQEEDGPPAKRQKMAGDKVPADETASASAEAAALKNGKKDDGEKASKKNHKFKKAVRPPFRVPERPIVTHLTTTSDGKYLVAVTGHDKVIWVLEHDGQGRLTQLSQRAMPKRPSAVVVAPGANGDDDTQILCADKFGDVYSLPLVPAAGAPGAAVTRPAARPLRQPAANALTVHSKRNLEALRDQQKQLELDRARLLEAKDKEAEGSSGSSGGADGKRPTPTFEMTLQLGHVSMLTDLVVAQDDKGRRYIVTSDRDEHIRVSRFMPQAHVIEGFCLGHTDFIGAMAVAGPSRPDVLVSGGGDDHLIAWDWRQAKPLARANALALARTVDPATPHVAISKIYTFVYPGEAGKQLTYVAVVSEGVKAILTWQLASDNTFINPGAIQLPGTPLSLAVVAPSTEEGAPSRMIVAMEPDVATPTAKSLCLFTLTTSEGRLAVDQISDEIGDYAIAGDGESHLEASEEEVHGLLYGIGGLRKQKILEAEGEIEAEAEVPEGGESEVLDDDVVEQ